MKHKRKPSSLKFCIGVIVLLFVVVQVALITSNRYSISYAATGGAITIRHHKASDSVNSTNHVASSNLRHTINAYHHSTKSTENIESSRPSLDITKPNPGIISGEFEYKPTSAMIEQSNAPGKSTAAPIQSISPEMKHPISPHYNMSTLMVLPAVSRDVSEMILNSVIERTTNSWALYVTTFFVSSAVLDPNEARNNKIDRLHINTIPTWTQVVGALSSVPYLPNGQRSPSIKYYCRLRHSPQEASYVVEGIFLPNRQTTDSNANRRQDILRCPVLYPKDTYARFARSETTLIVEIFRSHTLLANFGIPWRTRRTGFLMSSPPEASRFDAWKGFSAPGELVVTESTPKPSSPASPGDNVYLCIPQYGHVSLSQKLFYIAEFIQHHLLIGADHIFLTSEFSYSSRNMAVLLRTMRSYIEEGALTIVSEAGDGKDFAATTRGLWWNDIAVMNYHLNSCLYLAKGTAHYVAVWNMDELFVPKPPHHTIMDVIRSASAPPGQDLHKDMVTSPSNWQGGPGWADKDGHPFCYLSLYSAAIYPRTMEDDMPTKVSRPFFAARYTSPPQTRPTAPSQAILPTDRIFQGGMFVSGVCKLDWEWTGCSGPEPVGYADGNTSTFCFSPDRQSGNFIGGQLTRSTFSSGQKFDSLVFERDTKKVDQDTGGVLYKLQSYSYGMASTKSRDMNDYAKSFAPRVEEELLSRFGRETLKSFILPDKKPLARGDSTWPDFDLVFKGVQTLLPPVGESNPEVDSSNGYYNFADDFARPDIVDNRPESTLPAFAADYTDLALASVIERGHDTWDLHVTTFFLCHRMVWEPPPGYGIRGLRQESAPQWRKAIKRFNETQYHSESGRRLTSPNEYTCRIRHSEDSQPYDVVGEFMPNANTPDSNANRRLDIFRCKMQQSEWAYRHFAGSNEKVDVEIRRNGVVLFQFRVPWKTRRHGFLMSSPAMADSFDAWKGFDRDDTSGALPGSKGGDELYMSVPGLESPLSQRTLPMYAEFLQHHYLLGVDHIFMAATYAWNGKNMADFLTAMHSFIDDKLLTVNSQAGDNIDLLYSVLGVAMDRDNVKIFYVNMCLYLVKGVVDYMAIWDIDEYFIPRFPHQSIMDVIRAVESPQPLAPLPNDTNLVELQRNWKGGRGWADGDAHPFCFLMLFSEVIYSNMGYPEIYDPKRLWVGQKYTHLPESKRTGLSFKKSIVPTRRIFQAGLHMHGACSLPHAFRDRSSGGDCTPDQEFCNAMSSVHYDGMSRGYDGTVPFSLYHRFDSRVGNKDTKRVDQQSEATIYHFQMHRSYLSASEESMNGTVNEYVTRFFPSVLNELKRRSLNLLVALPYAVNTDVRMDQVWLPLYKYSERYLNPAGDEDLRELSVTIPIAPSYPTHHSDLPVLVKDFSEVVIGAMIEREHASWKLHLSTLFMAHEQLANATGKVGNTVIRPDTLGAYMHATKHSRNVTYNEVGERHDGYSYFCRITQSQGATPYVVRGRFVPNELTPDVNANKRLDILRCPIQNAQSAYQQLAGSNNLLLVEILRDNYSLVKFSVPWKSRRTGFMLTSPPGTSRLDPWKGYDRKTSVLPGDAGVDDLHMCVPGIESPISKRSLALYLEFFQHHFNMGVQHMHIAATYTWGSANMNMFLEAVRTYIDDGLMSVASEAGDEDLVYGLLGMSIHRDNVKIFNVNMCLYYTKGVADYLAIWDIDEYFIPKPPHHSIMDVIRSADSVAPLTPVVGDPFELFPKWKGGRGWADGDAHPLCYLMLSSEVLYRPEDAPDEGDPAAPWVGNRFTRRTEVERTGLGFKKSILPTRKLFQGGLHMSGGCKLDYPFNGCDKDVDGFCYSTFPRHRYGLTIKWNTTDGSQDMVDFSLEQRFDGLILDKDAKKINKDTEAVIYHVQVHRKHYRTTVPVNSTNDYVSYFFRDVVTGMRKRGLDLLVTLPPRKRNVDLVDKTLKWYRFQDYYASVSRDN